MLARAVLRPPSHRLFLGLSSGPRLAASQTRSYAKNKQSKYRPPPPPQQPRRPPIPGEVSAGETATTREVPDDGTVDPLGGAPKSSPQKPLPDLTKGIPSTLEAELSSNTQDQDQNDLGVSENARGGSGSGTPRSDYVSSIERRQRRVFYWLWAIFLSSATIGSVSLGRNWDTKEEEDLHPDAPNGWGLGLFWNRLKARLGGTLDYYKEPAFQKLLPDPDPAWERPYTLVLSLEDLLVHSEWDRQNGWRIAKRPGVDYFIRYLSQYYELVIFTSVPSMIAKPILDKLDPYHIVMWPLFREATKYKNGEYIKDLSFLNRPLNRVILLDTKASHAKNQPENAIILNKWKGDTQDTELVSFIPFLEYMAAMEFTDVRQALKSFKGTHIPTEYAKREALARQKFNESQAAEKGKGSKRSVSSLGSLFGMKSSGPDGMEQSVAEGAVQGKMFQDLVRERGQKTFENIDREIRENGDKWLKEMADEEKKAADEAMEGMKSNIANYVPFSGRREKPSSEKGQ